MSARFFDREGFIKYRCRGIESLPSRDRAMFGAITRVIALAIREATEWAEQSAIPSLEFDFETRRFAKTALSTAAAQLDSIVDDAEMFFGPEPPN